MSNETSQETWNATHAQLLKSVADAQTKMLAGINVLEDRLNEPFKVGPKLDSWLEGINDRLGYITGRLDAIEALLAPPCRPVERLRTKQIVKAVKAPQRKQRR